MSLLSGKTRKNNKWKIKLQHTGKPGSCKSNKKKTANIFIVVPNYI